MGDFEKKTEKIKFDGITRAAVLAICLVAVGIGYFLFRTATPPEAAMLTKRFVKSVELGWPLLQVKDANLQGLEPNGSFYNATFGYTIIIQEPYATLGTDEKQRVKQFLPMCVALFEQGKTACSMSETMVFVERQGAGWIPLEMAQRRTDLIDKIIAE